MRDKDLYARIPGIKSPWQVSSVELYVTEGDVTAEVEQEVGMRACCPGSGKESPGYDSRRRRWRRWRQLDSCQYMTITLAVSRLMKLSWNAIDGIMQRAVNAGSDLPANLAWLALRQILMAYLTDLPVAPAIPLTWVITTQLV